jgi:hypothetical protein
MLIILIYSRTSDFGRGIALCLVYEASPQGVKASRFTAG